MRDDPLNRLKVKRGIDLPQSKLNESDVKLIRGLIKERDRLKREISELTNEKIAEKFAVHRRTIERLSSGETWWHI